jgi:hypothetical protein
LMSEAKNEECNFIFHISFPFLVISDLSLVI